jgi:hypothetical protein
VEGFNDYKVADVFDSFTRELKHQQHIFVQIDTFKDFERFISNNNELKLVLIIDEIEGLNPELFNQFLHTIRNLYHFRDEHCLKSVILVGVSNIIGVVQDNASPFNIADNLPVDYFTREEVFELLGQHEAETGQLFEGKVKEKIYSITGGQPGLVNGFAWKLVDNNPAKKVINYDDYLKVEEWYLYEAIDKNISNVINKAKQYREFVERLLFDEIPVQFRINDEKIKYLSVLGVIKKGRDGNVVFRVPLYKKALYDAFYPFMNGEGNRISRNLFIPAYLNGDRINFDKLIADYKAYVKRRSFRYFREKDEKTGKYKQIKEAALVYSFETFIQIFLQEADGKSYLEAHTGLGRSDLIINVNNKEYVIEAKIYRSPGGFEKGRRQLAYYCRSVNIDEGIYLVFVPNDVKNPYIRESTEKIEGVEIKTFIVIYDEEKDF